MTSGARFGHGPKGGEERFFTPGPPVKNVPVYPTPDTGGLTNASACKAERKADRALSGAPPDSTRQTEGRELSGVSGPCRALHPTDGGAARNAIDGAYVSVVGRVGLSGGREGIHDPEKRYAGRPVSRRLKARRRRW